jgi:hypothetical protein
MSPKVSCRAGGAELISDLPERAIRPQLLPAPRRRGDRAHRPELIVVQIADIAAISQPDIGMRIGQNLLRRPTKIANLDRAEGCDDVPVPLRPEVSSLSFTQNGSTDDPFQPHVLSPYAEFRILTQFI